MPDEARSDEAPAVASFGTAERSIAITRVDPDLVVRAHELAVTGRIILGLTGAPGAGKTTVAEQLVSALGESAVHVPMDGFHLSDFALTELGIIDRKGAPETFDARGYSSLLERIRTDLTHTVYAPAFDRDLEQPIAGSVAIEPWHRVVVSEGNYLLLQDDLWAGVATHFDKVWYLETDPQVRLGRIIDRHIRFGKSADAAHDWVESVDEQNALRVLQSRDRADLIVDVTHLDLSG